MDFFILSFHGLEDNLDYEVDDFHPADEGEASQEAHGATYSRDDVHKLRLSVLKLSIKQTQYLKDLTSLNDSDEVGGVEKNPNEVKGAVKLQI